MKSGTTGITRAISKRRRKIPTITLRLPIYWASALINGDESGLDVQDINQIDAMMAELLAQYESVHAVDVGEADFCSHHDGQRWGALAGDCATYTFHVGAEKKVKVAKGERGAGRRGGAKIVRDLADPPLSVGDLMVVVSDRDGDAVGYDRRAERWYIDTKKGFQREYATVYPHNGDVVFDRAPPKWWLARLKAAIKRYGRKPVFAPMSEVRG